MRNGSRLAIGAGIIGVAVIGFYLGVAITAANTCPDASSSVLAVCRLEQWLSRYQSLIAGSLAIIAAVIAADPVRKQVRVSQHQSSISTLPLLRDEIASRVDEDKILVDISKILTEMEVKAKEIRNPDKVRICFRSLSEVEASRIISVAESTESRLREHVARHPLGFDIDNVRLNPGHMARATAKLFELFIVDEKTLGVIQFDFLPQSAEKQIEEFNSRFPGHLSTARDALKRAEEAAFSHNRELQAALSETNRRIRSTA